MTPEETLIQKFKHHFNIEITGANKKAITQMLTEYRKSIPAEIVKQVIYVPTTKSLLKNRK